ncbi:DUF4229 domain-containing protein [Demequina pelophila]|uniref:DUF4229 domain-containing protein n=1 Tax=Demequina pelophila TaxID=1638984 RepID=UPI000785A136|nr:DUF4229 domain-containing protein [Demequina pelophila]
MSVLTYWAARTGVFLAMFAILWLVGWRDLLAFFAAFMLGWLVSYLAFPGLRVRANEQMAGWITRSEKGIREADAEEDAELESRREA